MVTRLLRGDHACMVDGSNSHDHDDLRWAATLAANPTLAAHEGQVSDSGEGRWTVQAAIDEAGPAPGASAALYARFGSSGDTYSANRVQSAMRYEIGGEVEKPAPCPASGA